jgi:hypothetical protein
MRVLLDDLQQRQQLQKKGIEELKGILSILTLTQLFQLAIA